MRFSDSNQAASKVVDRLLSNGLINEADKEPPKIFRQTLDRAYKDYEVKAGRALASRAIDGLPKVSRHRGFLDSLSKAEKIAVVFGNLNYQVHNGGFRQWIDNRYFEDTIDILREFIEEYGDSYDSLKALGPILDEVEHLSESDDPDTIIQKAEDALNDEDWDELDNILNGSDYTQFNFERAVKAEIEQEMDVSTDEKNGKFSYTVTCFDEVVKKSPFKFDNEDDAYEAGNEEWEDGDDDFPESVTDRAKEEVINRFAEEIRKFVHKSSGFELDALDNKYYELSPKILEQIGSILRTEHSVSGDIKRFVVGSIEKAKKSLSSTARNARAGISDLLSKAATKIKPK